VNHKDVRAALSESTKGKAVGRILYDRRLQVHRRKSDAHAKKHGVYFAALADAAIKVTKFMADEPDEISDTKFLWIYLGMWQQAAKLVLKQQNRRFMQRVASALTNSN